MITTILTRFRTRSRRAQSLGLFTITALGSRGAGIICQLIQVPLALHALGAEAFGLWMTLMSVSSLVTFADFGLGQGAQNVLAEDFAAERVRSARSCIVTALTFLFAVSAAVAAIGLVAIALVDINSVFGLKSPETQQVSRRAVGAVLIFFCVNFPLGFAQRIAYARQKAWMHNISQAASAVGALIGVAWCAQHHGSLVEFILCAHLPLAGANALLLTVQLGQLGWRNFSHRQLDWPRLKGMLRLGTFFSLQQILNLLLFSGPPVVISTALGAAAVTPFNVLQRFFNIFGIIQNSFMLPLWPAYAEAKVRGEYSWVRRTLRRSFFATLGCTLAPMVLATLLAKPILRLWIGSHSALPSTPLIWLMFCWNATVFLQQPFGYLLAGFSEVKRTTLYAMLSAAICAALMAWWVRTLGPSGVVLALLVGCVPFNLVGNIIEALRVSRAEDSSLLTADAPELLELAVKS